VTTSRVVRHWKTLSIIARENRKEDYQTVVV
jgi:hypothetical protein